MKTFKYILIALLLLPLSILFGQSTPSNSENYVLTRTPRASISNVSAMNRSNTLYEIGYFNKLGQLDQTVLQDRTPHLNHLVKRFRYNWKGQAIEETLPVPAYGISREDYYDDFLETVRDYYSNDDPLTTYQYENSYISRPRTQIGAGEVWGSTYHWNETSHAVNQNDGSDLSCARFNVSAQDTLITITRTLNDYLKEELFVTVTVGEDKDKTHEFKNRLGQTLLTRQWVGNRHDTHYVYNDLGQLVAVLPPVIADSISKGTTLNSVNPLIRKYTYLYCYDTRGNCIAKKLPGADWVFYIYDKANRVILTQDGEHRGNGQWFFSIPDAHGRVVLTGTCGNQFIYSADPLKNVVVKAAWTGADNKGYKVSGLTLSGTVTVLSANYYDNYNFMGLAASGIPAITDSNFKPEIVSNYDSRYEGNYTGLLTGTLTARLDGTSSTKYLYSVMYYDYYGRVVQTKSNSHLAGGIEKEYVAYNFSGQPVRRMHVHIATGRSTQTEYYSYAYDHTGRLLTTTHQLQGSDPVVLASNTYDELGRLYTQKKGSLPATTYEYNIRSWVTSIQNSLFTQNLYYNEDYAGNTPCYNGNISAMSWKIGSETLRGYRFAYDDLSRLTKADYLLNGVANTSYKVPSITYDKHSNITSLERWGKTGSGHGVVDQLTMGYNGNQLLKVTDAGVKAPDSGAGLNDFKDAVNEVKEYFYNRNGSLTKDLNKGVSNISYNSLNLPAQLTIGSVVNKYTYAADGRKLQVKYGTGADSIDYVGNKVYEKGSLKCILVDGGYIDMPSKVYHFYLTDHQGNNRVVATGTGTIVQKNHYYPFGMTFGEVSATEQDQQRYKYNGKELDRKNGLNLYDYSARYYEPALGRFTTMDPLAEKFCSISPYAYCRNNSINAIDPDGRDIIVLHDRNGALGFGHTAILIGNDTDGWRYLSKDGGKGIIVSGGPNVGSRRFDNIKQFNKSTFARQYHGYQSRARFSTTKEQDEAAYEAMQTEVNSWYDVQSNNCMDAVATALRAAGFYAEKSHYTGTDNPYADPVLIGEPRPNPRYDRLLEKNKKFIVDKTENANIQYYKDNKSNSWSSFFNTLKEWLTINPNIIVRF